MSLLPYLLERRRALEQLCANDEGILTAILPYVCGDSLPPYPRARSGDGAIKTDKNMFQINLDVHHFAPEEVSVKTADGFIIVEGRHEEKRDEHGWVSRQFTRRYPLPEGCSPAAVVSRLSSDGVLSVAAPRAGRADERAVPIVHTGPVRTDRASRA